MTEIELCFEEIDSNDNTINVEMSVGEIAFLKYFIKKYHPKKIVEIGVSAGGNTVNLLNWKDKDAQLFSIDISPVWYRDDSKLTGFMANEFGTEDNWTIYRGVDYLDVYEDIGDDIDCIVLDTSHVMPGEILTFLATLPQVKDDCIFILHDIHLNMMRFSRNNFNKTDFASYCTGLLFGGVSSNNKYTLKAEPISNIAAFVVDNSTRQNIKDLFHILCSSWHFFPSGIDFYEYKKFIQDNYSLDCYNLFNSCLILHANYFDVNIHQTSEIARVDIINSNNKNNSIEIINAQDNINIDFPDWFKGDNGEGVVLYTNEKSFDIKLKCINDGSLSIFLKGPHILNSQGKHIPSYVNFNKLIINNESIIENCVTCWHDDPYIFEKNVKDGEVLNLHFEWTLYQGPTIPFKGFVNEFK